ncbi:MAG: branched-chain amino acid ABC transporter permease [Defluviitaleaceae bacterium]|nr:branched-chain amino acid ABC transporter permease [Defluviitaleaceae bacterium]
MNVPLQILFNSLDAGGRLALATMGIILIFRTSSAFNFAQGAISMFCAFIAASFLQSTGMNVWVSSLVGVLGAVGIGVIVDRVVIKRTLKLHSVHKQIITLGLVMVFLGLAPMLFGTTNLLYPRFAQGSHNIFSATLTNGAIVNIVIGLSVMGLLFFVIQKTKWGLGVRATASNDTVARMMGIPTPLVTMGAWAVAAALGGLSAMMIAPDVQVQVGMMDSIQITALLACVLGGLGTFVGPVFAAYLIALSRNFISFYISSTWADAIVYLLILGVLMLAPNGIFGKKILKKV